MFTSRLFPLAMQADRPEYRDATVELSDAEIRKALQVPPPEHAQANEAQFEALLMQTSPCDLRNMVRELRKLLAGAEFAARTNAETVAALWSKRR